MEQLEVIKYIIENTDQANHSDAFGTTPLLLYCKRFKEHLSCYEDRDINEEIVENILSKAKNKNPADATGYTPLHTEYIQWKPKLVK